MFYDNCVCFKQIITEFLFEFCTDCNSTHHSIVVSNELQKSTAKIGC